MHAWSVCVCETDGQRSTCSAMPPSWVCTAHIVVTENVQDTWSLRCVSLHRLSQERQENSLVLAVALLVAATDSTLYYVPAKKKHGGRVNSALARRSAAISTNVQQFFIFLLCISLHFRPNGVTPSHEHSYLFRATHSSS